MEIWLISDTHFWHENILNFKEPNGDLIRSFNSVQDMNEVMIRNWNSVVKPDDKIYHLGDVGFSNFVRLKEIFDRLNGNKILIKGNHDRLKLSQYAQIFKDVRAYHILDKFLLAHIPIHPLSLERWKGQIHGHLHTRVIPDSRYFNVSVERIKYTPINFNEIKKYYEII